MGENLKTKNYLIIFIFVFIAGATAAAAASTAASSIGRVRVENMVLINSRVGPDVFDAS